MGKLKIILYYIIVTILVGAYFGPILYPSSNAVADTNGNDDSITILTSNKIDTSIKVDGQSDEEDWSSARIIKVPVVGGLPKPLNISIRSLYDGAFVYFFLEWKDPTQSDDFHQWVFNETGDGNWSYIGNEDRISMIWNINNSITGFNIGGCALVCHLVTKHTNGPGQIADIWQWKASRTNPMGYAEDGFIDDTVDNDLNHSTHQRAMAAHKMDSYDEGNYYSNGDPHWNDPTGTFGQGPLYYEPYPFDEEDASAITRQEVEKGEAVLVPTEPKFSRGFTVPGTILDIPRYNGTSGPAQTVSSSADISAKGRWDDGQWHVEVKRLLDTGHDDDILFDTALTYRFGIALMDNSSGFQMERLTGHSISQLAYTLEFGGIGSEEVTKFTLVRDYLIAAKGYASEDNRVSAQSEISNAFFVFSDVEFEASQADPSLFMEIKAGFVEVKSDPSPYNLQELIKKVDKMILTFQDKRTPNTPGIDTIILANWLEAQDIIFFIVAILFIYPFYLVIRTGIRPTWRKLSLFLILFIIPVFMIGFSHIGMRIGIEFASLFSFMTNDYARIIWVIIMGIGIVFAHYGIRDINQNIQRSKVLNKDLRKANKQLRLLDRQRSEFIDVVSHELRTPLTLIKTNLDMMRLGFIGHFDFDDMEKVRVMDKNVKKINNSITDMLFLSQVDSNTLKIRREKIFIPVFVSNVMEDLSPLAAEKDQKIIIDVPMTTPPIYADANQIKRALTNIVANAIKYTPPKGMIRISVKEKGKDLVFEVKDSGIGIPKDQLDHIFEKFYVVDSTLTRSSESIGLGLPIAKGIIKAHGGDIRVESTHKKGSSFFLTLPKSSKDDLEDEV